MARPIKNNLDYFPHDNSMRNDRKIKALRSKYGIEGYAIYNMLLETLCECDLLIIKWDEVEIELVSGDLTIVSDKLTQVSEYLCKVGLLKIVNGYMFSEQLDKRAESVFGKRTKDLSSLRIENGINVSETLVSDEITLPKESESTQSKGKESKGKESKGNKSVYRKFKHLSITHEENQKLLFDGYTQEQIDSTYDSIENYKKNTSYESLYLTAKKWLKKEHGTPQKKDLFSEEKKKIKVKAWGLNTTGFYEVEKKEDANQLFYNDYGAYPSEITVL